MHVYQPFDLVMGLFMFPLGLVGLGLNLHRVFSRTFRNTFADWYFAYLSLWLASAGPYYCSRAFDPPHDESHLTSVLRALEVSVLSLFLIAGGVVWIVHRRRKTDGSLNQRAARGNRGRFEQALAKVGAVTPDEQDRL